jgi:HK97 family phage major capsid protein
MDSLTLDQVLEAFDKRCEEREAKKSAQEKSDQDAKARLDALKKEIKDEVKAELGTTSKPKADDEDPNANAGKTPAAFGAAVHFGKKLSKEEQMIVDGLMTKNIPGNGLEMKFKLDVQDGEDRLRYYFRHQAKEGKKVAIDGSSSYGADIVPEVYGTDLYVRATAMHGDLAKLFPKVGMTSDVEHIMELLGKITVSAYSSYANQNTAIENVTPTSETTGSATLTARTFVAKENVYDRTAADTKVNLVRALKTNMATEFASSLSKAILNGDTTATHMDEDLEAAGANIPEAMWKGLRKLTMAGSLGTDGTDAAYTIANLLSVRAKMGKYALGPNKQLCKWIFGVESYNKLVGLLLAQTAAPQMANYTLEGGDVDTFLGHEVLVSQHQREDLEIDGYADSTGTDGNQGFISLVNPNGFVLGVREEISVRLVPDPLNARTQIQGTLLMDFQPLETPSASISVCSGLYGFTV